MLEPETDGALGESRSGPPRYATVGSFVVGWSATATPAVRCMNRSVCGGVTTPARHSTTLRFRSSTPATVWELRGVKYATTTRSSAGSTAIASGYWPRAVASSSMRAKPPAP
ncbi:MAG: hypothetical protein IAE78_11185, partial [Myxococcus sp.]|nr:hypothetical protein [Myxococcus sp.]